MKTRKILAILVLMLVVVDNSFAGLPLDWYQADIREWAPVSGGSVSYDEAIDRWTVTTPGYSGDLLYQHKCFVYKECSGNVQIIARIHNAYGGVMIRRSLLFNSSGWVLSINSSKAVFSKIKEGVLSAGGVTPDVIQKDIEGLPYWVRLERKDREITAYVSRYGIGPWAEVGSFIDTLDPDMSELDPVYIGFYVPTVSDDYTVQFDNVNIGPPSTGDAIGGVTIPFELIGSVSEPGSVMSVINVGNGNAITGIANNTGDVMNFGGFFASEGQSGAGVSALSTGVDGIGLVAMGTDAGGTGILASGGFLAGFFDGHVMITGDLDINGSIYQRGSRLHADYVFQPDYSLESIDEHSQFMWEHGHLKAIPKAQVDGNGREIVEAGAHRRGIVEELEKAHIYIEQLNNRIKALEEKLAKLEAGLPAGQ